MKINLINEFEELQTNDNKPQEPLLYEGQEELDAPMEFELPDEEYEEPEEEQKPAKKKAHIFIIAAVVAVCVVAVIVFAFSKGDKVKTKRVSMAVLYSECSPGVMVASFDVPMDSKPNHKRNRLININSNEYLYEAELSNRTSYSDQYWMKYEDCEFIVGYDNINTNSISEKMIKDPKTESIKKIGKYTCLLSVEEKYKSYIDLVDAKKTYIHRYIFQDETARFSVSFDTKKKNDTEMVKVCEDIIKSFKVENNSQIATKSQLYETDFYSVLLPPKAVAIYSEAMRDYSEYSSYIKTEDAISYVLTDTDNPRNNMVSLTISKVYAHEVYDLQSLFGVVFGWSDNNLRNQESSSSHTIQMGKYEGFENTKTLVNGYRELDRLVNAGDYYISVQVNYYEDDKEIKEIFMQMLDSVDLY